MPLCYIIFSPAANKYYIGQTIDFDNRLLEHNSGKYQQSYTHPVSDWETYLLIECSSKTQAIKIESFIKRMKSRSFIEKLKANPSIVTDILNRFSD